MNSKKILSFSKSQQLMAYSYLCATGKVIKEFSSYISPSFLNRKKKGLPEKINSIMKLEELDNKDVITFLYSVNLKKQRDKEDLNGLIGDFIKSKDALEKSEIIEDILLEIGNDIGDNEYIWVEDE